MQPQLNTLPSPANKWSAMTHPLQTTAMEFNGMIISYVQFYFHHGQVFFTHTHVTSTTSTVLDNESRHNCRMTDIEFRVFALLVF